MDIQLPDEAGNVIELSIVRESRYGRKFPGSKLCPHERVTLDTTLTSLKCRDCGEGLNPIEYIVMLTEQWHRVDRLYKTYREAHAKYEAKKKTRCEHCSKMTRVVPASPAEVREFNRART